MSEAKINQQWQEVWKQTEIYYAVKLRQAREERQAITWAELIVARNQYLAWICTQRDAQLARVRGVQCL